ncbi:MAG: phosphodiester glycosidase family protein [Acidobacteria bacterium]|nr:phosphodiester glycosidase family protein [Acidobacteriota bacterium]
MMKPAAALVLLLLSTCVASERPVEREIADDSPAGAGAVASSPKDCSPEWRELETGLRHRNHCKRGEAALHLVEIDPRLWTLDAARVPPTTAPAVARESGAHFAINANFFTPERKTLGIIVSSGQSVQKPHPVSWQSIFYLTADGSAAIVLPERWPAVQSEATMAVQAGPRIVVDGKRNQVARATPSLRSGVCLTGDRRIVFFATMRSHFYDVHEMVDLAALNEGAGGLGCRDAMLFDGGPSAQMHLEGAGISIEGDLVPAFVIARAKSEGRTPRTP